MMRERPARPRLMPLIVVLLLGALPSVLFGASVMEGAAGLHELAYGPNPYFIPGHALMLYILAPLVALSGFALLLGPGLMLALALGRGRTIAVWMINGFALSLAIITLGAMLVQTILAEPLKGWTFGLMTLVCTLVSAHLAWIVSREWPDRFAIPAFDRHDWAALGIATGLGWLIIAALAPKFFWESFNGDGLHYFESARLMLHQPLPFWPASAEDFATWPGIKSVLCVFPGSWLVRLFGEYELSARLAYVLILIPLACALMGVIEQGQRRRMRPVERLLLAGALALFTLVMGFSASEDPYNADIALPGVQDALLMLFFCGYLLAFLKGETKSLSVSVVLLYLTSPNTLPMLGAWLIGVTLFLRPVPWRLMAHTLGALVVMIALEALAPHVLALVQLAPPGSEHGTIDLVKRLVHIQLDQIVRFSWAFVPVGIAPALAIFLGWRWQDRVTRALSLCALILFAFYYLQYRSALHYFVPATILALVVYWRMLIGLPANSTASAAAPALTLTALLASLALSWPTATHPVMASRDVGTQIEDRTTGYERGDPATFHHVNILQALFPRPADPRVPEHAYGGHPQIWNYYAHRADAPAFPRNYVLQPADYPPVPLARLIAMENGYALYVRDEALWRKQASLILPATSGSMLYYIPEDVLFTNGPHSALLNKAREALRPYLPNIIKPDKPRSKPGQKEQEQPQ